jgi:hypothetical protein
MSNGAIEPTRQQTAEFIEESLSRCLSQKLVRRPFEEMTDDEIREYLALPEGQEIERKDGAVVLTYKVQLPPVYEGDIVLHATLGTGDDLS